MCRCTKTTWDAMRQEMYHSNCVVESKPYFGDSFEPGLHNNELNYEDLPKTVTELNSSRSAAAPNGRRVKDNMLQLLERGKQKLFRPEEEGALNGKSHEAGAARNGKRKAWDQVRQKIFPTRKNSSGSAGKCLQLSFFYRPTFKDSNKKV